MNRIMRRLANRINGTAMIEFALLLPVMLCMYFGTVEITETVIAKRRLNLVVTTIADLTAQAQLVQQQQTVSSSDMTAIFAAAGAVMGTSDTSNLKMRISSIIVYPTGRTCVDWSVGQNMTPLTSGATNYVVPNSITLSASTSARDFIVAEGTLSFLPITRKIIPTTINLSEGPTYVVPRETDRVVADTTIQNPAAPCA